MCLPGRSRRIWSLCRRTRLRVEQLNIRAAARQRLRLEHCLRLEHLVLGTVRMVEWLPRPEGPRPLFSWACREFLAGQSGPGGPRPLLAGACGKFLADQNGKGGNLLTHEAWAPRPARSFAKKKAPPIH